MTELNEVIDDNYNVLDILPREKIIKKNLKHKAALVIVKNSQNQFYIHQRKHTKEVNPLKWVVGAGGAVNLNESFYDAAKRELKEELGIESIVNFLFDFDYKSDINNYKAKIYITNYNGKITLDKNECEQGKWISLDELKFFIENDLLCPDTALYIKKYLEKKN